MFSLTGSRRKKAEFLGGIAILALCFAIGGSRITTRGASAPHKASVKEVYHVDRLVFADLREIVRWSPLVVEGKIVSELRSYRLPLDPSSSNHGPMDNGPLRTDYSVKVLDVVRGANVSPGDFLTVTAEGGNAAGVEGVEAGNPLPQIGSTEIMFLHNNPNESGTYMILGVLKGALASWMGASARSIVRGQSGNLLTDSPYLLS